MSLTKLGFKELDNLTFGNREEARVAFRPFSFGLSITLKFSLPKTMEFLLRSFERNSQFEHSKSGSQRDVSVTRIDNYAKDGRPGEV